MLIRWEYNRFIVAMAIIMVAAAARIWPLQALGALLVWLTFYLLGATFRW